MNKLLEEFKGLSKKVALANSEPTISEAPENNPSDAQMPPDFDSPTADGGDMPAWLPDEPLTDDASVNPTDVNKAPAVAATAAVSPSAVSK